MKELEKYELTDDGHQFDMDREDDETDIENIGRYEIVFEVDDKRYYCFADAINMNEALGLFFVNHPHVSYDMIIDHMEI